MYRRITIPILFISVVLGACRNSADKKIVTGLVNVFNGLTFEQAYLLGPDSTVLLVNKVPLNGNIVLVINGVGNLVVKDGKVFPGVSLTVSIGNQTVIQKDDLLASTDGFLPDEVSTISGSVKLSPPVQANQVYHIKMRVWDKNSIHNELSSEVDIEVQ